MTSDSRRLMEEVTVDVPFAGRLFGLERNAAYRACKAGDIPSIRVGGKLRVPTARLREMLQIPAGRAQGEATA